MTFNPSILGFDDSVSATKNGRNNALPADACYVRLDKGCYGGASLVMGENVFNLVMSVCGSDTCDVAIDANGRIAVYAGSRRKLSVVGSHKNSKGRSVSVRTIRDYVFKHYGQSTFRMHMDAELYDGEAGTAVIFTPNGNVDRRGK